MHGLMTKDTMMSVRDTPWHRLGKVLADYPTDIGDALEKSGLGWGVGSGSVMYSLDVGDPLEALRVADKIAAAYSKGGVADILAAEVEEYLAARARAPRLILADEYRANVRKDDDALLGIVGDEYKIVQNLDAFKFLDALIGSDLYFETAGSLLNGKKVWVLARLPEWVEVGGDQTAMMVYVANAHDGSMAVTSSVTDVKIVCQNTLTWALNKSEKNAPRTYKFRHTGDLAIKFDEARRVMGMTLDYSKQFKALGDRLALVRVTTNRASRMAQKLFPIDPDTMGKIAVKNREAAAEAVVSIFNNSTGTEGNAPGTAWTYANAVAEYADWMRRYTSKTDQMYRSFEDVTLKQQGYEQAVSLLK